MKIGRAAMYALKRQSIADGTLLFELWSPGWVRSWGGWYTFQYYEYPLTMSKDHATTQEVWLEETTS